MTNRTPVQRTSNAEARAMATQNEANASAVAIVRTSYANTSQQPGAPPADPLDKYQTEYAVRAKTDPLIRTLFCEIEPLLTDQTDGNRTKILSALDAKWQKERLIEDAEDNLKHSRKPKGFRLPTTPQMPHTVNAKLDSVIQELNKTYVQKLNEAILEGRKMDLEQHEAALLTLRRESRSICSTLLTQLISSIPQLTHERAEILLNEFVRRFEVFIRNTNIKRTIRKAKQLQKKQEADAERERRRNIEYMDTETDRALDSSAILKLQKDMKKLQQQMNHQNQSRPKGREKEIRQQPRHNSRREGQASEESNTATTTRTLKRDAQKSKTTNNKSSKYSRMINSSPNLNRNSRKYSNPAHPKGRGMAKSASMPRIRRNGMKNAKEDANTERSQAQRRTSFNSRRHREGPSDQNERKRRRTSYRPRED